MNDVYLRAAELIFEYQEEFSCHAIQRLTVSGFRHRLVDWSYEAYEYRDIFIEYEDEYPNMFDDRHERIIALLFMHEIANS